MYIYRMWHLGQRARDEGEVRLCDGHIALVVSVSDVVDEFTHQSQIEWRVSAWLPVECVCRSRNFCCRERERHSIDVDDG